MTNTIAKTIELAAPIDRVWRALTDYQEFGAWFRVKLAAPFAVGVTASGHIAYPGYEHLAWNAHVTAMAPYHFAFTWHPYAVDPAQDYTAETPTLVSFRLEETPNGTRLLLTESGFDKIPPHRMPEALRMNDNGWAEQIQNIKAHVEK